MLFVLTGDIQIGKTRWLLQVTEELAAKGVRVEGVVAPGVWVPRGSDFEKLGIDNRLLPQNEQFRFATRLDLAQEESSVVLQAPAQELSKNVEGDCAFRAHASNQNYLAPLTSRNPQRGFQGDPSRMGWSFDPAAIKRVNEHFSQLSSQVDEESTSLRDAPASENTDAPLLNDSACTGLLVVDELGKLELLREEGLTEAMRLLDRGPNARYQHALVVVRSTLFSLVYDRYVHVWGDVVTLSPRESSREVVFRAFSEYSKQ